MLIFTFVALLGAAGLGEPAAGISIPSQRDLHIVHTEPEGLQAPKPEPR